MIVKLLLFLISFVLAGSHFPRPSSKIIATFNEKIVSGDIVALQSILDSNPKFIKSSFAKPYRNRGFIEAVQEGRAPVVEFMLKNGNVNAATSNNKAIRLASANGNYDIVKLLLERPEVNPGAENDEAIITASKNGHTEIVRMLLTLPEVDPGAMKNEALIKATRNGHIEVVRLLLAHPNVKFSARNYLAVYWASELNHSDIVKLLVQAGSANSDFYEYTLEDAAAFGNVDLVRFLLGYPYFNHRADFVAVKGDLTTIKTLVEAGYTFDRETLDVFLQHYRSNGNDDVIVYLESLKEKPKLPTKPLVPMTEQCAICLSDENLLEGFLTSCNHQFHAECLQQWIAKQNSCPICRSSII